MAEESSVYELEQLEKQLQTLISRYSSDGFRGDGEPFCSDFCKVMEPEPKLQEQACCQRQAYMLADSPPPELLVTHG